MTVATLTLTEFLALRLAEHEAAAHDAVEVGWVNMPQPDGSFGWTALGTPTEEGWLVDGRLVQDVRAAVFYDPARALADVAAKRAIVERLSAVIGETPPESPFDDEGWELLAWETLHDLARVYADSPEFREEWR